VTPLDAVREYTRHGWPVFPRHCQGERRKQPGDRCRHEPSRRNRSYTRAGTGLAVRRDIHGGRGQFARRGASPLASRPGRRLLDSLRNRRSNTAWPEMLERRLRDEPPPVITDAEERAVLAKGGNIHRLR
jgi:hypothetical protein